VRGVCHGSGGFEVSWSHEAHGGRVPEWRLIISFRLVGGLDGG
jgi:hypothetical protein